MHTALRAVSLLVFMDPGLSHSQNLVPNWSFEDHQECPSAFNQIELATAWNKCLTNNMAPHHVDYIHTCGSDPFQAPDGFWGEQAPATGDAMAAISTRSPLAQNYRENIYAQLIVPMTVGEVYHVSIKVSHTDLSKGATANLGIRFSNTTTFPIDNSSHVYATAVIGENTLWITLNGTFVADSAYQYIGVGNFHDDASTPVTEVCPSCPYVHNEYYIDDICVLPDAPDRDLVSCAVAYSVGIGYVEPILPPDLSVSPTLLMGDDRIRVDVREDGVWHMMILDALGRVVSPLQWLGKGPVLGQVIRTPDLASGTYQVVVTDREDRVAIRRIAVLR